ncbi:MAG: flagellar export chaperone FliS [Acidimicrobiales bacterium]|jgi:flagellar protein FliS
MTMTRNPAARYQSNAVQTAPGPQLLVMLYDRLAADIEVAERAMGERDYFVANETVQHAQQIVRVLRHSLNPDGFEGGQELLSLYDFLIQHLVEANLEKNQAKIRECGTIVAPLQRAWHLAVVNPEGNDAADHVG